MIGNCETNKRNSTGGLYRAIPNFCPAVARIGLKHPGTIRAGDASLGILHVSK